MQKINLHTPLEFRLAGRVLSKDERELCRSKYEKPLYWPAYKIAKEYEATEEGFRVTKRKGPIKIKPDVEFGRLIPRAFWHVTYIEERIYGPDGRIIERIRDCNGNRQKIKYNPPGSFIGVIENE